MFASIFTFIACFVLLNLFAILLVRSDSPDLGKLFVWCFAPMVTSIFAVKYREDIMNNHLSGAWKPILIVASLQAGITSFISALASLMHLDIGFQNISHIKGLELAFLVYVSSVGLLIGGGLGIVMPKGYIKSIQLRRASEFAKDGDKSPETSGLLINDQLSASPTG
jgi:hypothetical protein